MLIENIFRSSKTNVEHNHDVIQNYLRIGVLVDCETATYIKARRRSDMTEVHIWLYKSPIDIEVFLQTIKKYSKLKKSSFLSYGINKEGHAFIVTNKIKLFSINNLKNHDLYSSLFSITKEICEAHSKNLFHGAFNDYSFGITDEGKYFLNEPIGLKGERLPKAEDDIFSLGLLFFQIVTRTKFPTFDTEKDLKKYLKYELRDALRTVNCPEDLVVIIAKTLNPETRQNFKIKDLLCELRARLNPANRSIFDTNILDSATLKLKNNIFATSKYIDPDSQFKFYKVIIFSVLALISTIIIISNLKFNSYHTHSIDKSSTDKGMEIIKNNLLAKGSFVDDLPKQKLHKLELNRIQSNKIERSNNSVEKIINNELIKSNLKDELAINISPKQEHRLRLVQSVSIETSSDRKTLNQNNLIMSRILEENINSANTSSVTVSIFNPDSLLWKLLKIEKLRDYCGK